MTESATFANPDFFVTPGQFGRIRIPASDLIRPEGPESTARFAADSPLEGAGFEPSVPQQIRSRFQDLSPVPPDALATRGPNSSNPSPSDGEMVWGRRRGNGTIVAVAN
jgi:hypothetical protein